MVVVMVTVVVMVMVMAIKALAESAGETHYPSERTADLHELGWLVPVVSDADHHLFGWWTAIRTGGGLHPRA